MADESGAKIPSEVATTSECLFYLDLMSHEVLNFNQAVLGYLEIVKSDPSIDDDVKRYLLSAIGQIRNSSQMIDDVKKIAHLGTMDESTFLPLDLRRIISEGLEELRAQFPDRKLRMNLKGVSDSVHVRATEALGDVIVHMLSNAVRFDTSDEVVIDISVERPTVAPGMVDIIVEGRGLGIPDRMRIASTEEPESDEKTNMARDMGLLLVRAAAKRFGGRLIISDRVPGDQSNGAKLTVRLPEAIMR